VNEFPLEHIIIRLVQYKLEHDFFFLPIFNMKHIEFHLFLSLIKRNRAGASDVDLGFASKTEEFGFLVGNAQHF
jgi:hypothetical protein